MSSLIEAAMGGPSKAWTLIKEHEEKRVVTVDTDGSAVQTTEPDIVEITLRVPEQFFTRKYHRVDWDLAMDAKRKDDAGETMELGQLWGLPEYLTDHWRSNIEIEDELYGPDGQQIW